jgi:hypothetical protein
LKFFAKQLWRRKIYLSLCSQEVRFYTLFDWYRDGLSLLVSALSLQKVKFSVSISLYLGWIFNKQTLPREVTAQWLSNLTFRTSSGMFKEIFTSVNVIGKNQHH